MYSSRWFSRDLNSSLEDVVQLKYYQTMGGVFVADISQESVSFRNVKWDFSLKEASWYGGFWERLVGQLKRCLKKTLGRAYLNFYELQTVTNEIELV